MHVFIAGLYAVVIWLSALLYCIIIKGPILAFLVLSPWIISAAIAFILALDLIVQSLFWVWPRVLRALMWTSGNR